jgi:hypothetical protein
MSGSGWAADDDRMTVAQLLSDVALDGRAPMPMQVPPVSSAGARRLRLARLREQVARSGYEVDVDAAATAIARRALFTGELSRRLADWPRA